MLSVPAPLARLVFDTPRMVAEHPPRLAHPHKKLVHRLACPADMPHAGTLTVSRWAPMPLRADVPAERPAIERADGFFAYPEPAAGSGEMIWHINFADAILFGHYGGALLAQDELQVAEHPALGSLREALAESELAPMTRGDEGGTPILVQGAERRCRLATEPNASEGRPEGLYGNRFAEAPAEVVQRAVKPIRPPTLTNLIAMEAPQYGHGPYTRGQILDILVTAMTGFRAARLESARADASRVTVHTGFWGCGAYGGNRTLMALLQLLAARLAVLDRLVFHATGAGGAAVLDQAAALLDEHAPAGSEVSAVVQGIVRLGFRWGITDGT